MTTQQRLRELLSYDPETGEFTWLVNRARNARVGSVAGSVARDGYMQVKLDGRIYKAHRLAWLYAYGTWPITVLDHRDTNRLNNRLANLREATPSQNKANTQAQSNNTSGVKGVHWNKASRKWQAYVRYQGRRLHLGYFQDLEAAAAAYKAKAAELFGEYARAS